MSRDKDIRATFAEIDRWTDPATARDKSDVALVDSIPASSPLIRDLRNQLRKIQDDQATPPELREQLSAVLTGKSDLNSLFAAGGLTLPAAGELPPGAQEVLTHIEEGDLDD